MIVIANLTLALAQTLASFTCSSEMKAIEIDVQRFVFCTMATSQYDVSVSMRIETKMC